MNWEESGRKWPWWHDWSTIFVFSSRNQEKHEENPVKVACNAAEIRNQYVQNEILHRYRYANLLETYVQI
jgi:hypothetical protein